MKVEVLVLRSIAKRCVSKDETVDVEIVQGRRDQSVERRSSGCAFRFRRLSDLTGSILALSTRGVSTRADTSVRDASAGLLRPVQRTRARHRARHQHLCRALVMEVAIGEAHARHRSAEAALVLLVEIEARLERNALDRRADGLAADLKRVAGQPNVTHRTGAAELHRAGRTADHRGSGRRRACRRSR